MKTLFKHGDGRLKTLRITIVVFVMVMIGLAVMYKMGKSVDKIFIKVDHVFESEKQAIEEKLKQEMAKAKQRVEHELKQHMPSEKASDQVKKPDQPQKTDQVKPAEQQNMVARMDPKPQSPPVEKAIAQTPVPKTTLPKPVQDRPDKSSTKQKTMFKTFKKERSEKPAQLELASEDYFELYRQWQAQGESLNGEPDEKSKQVGLKILNLENVYDLFQMKAVLVKEGSPHSDLEDHSRVAESALTEFSSTCFIVADPWEKWGPKLKKSGFSQTDNIEIRYYTYDFVRNSIYARAMKAFEWSLKQAGLARETDPGEADVLGRVYAVNRKGGGAFGVFVPRRVDFRSGGSVQVDAMTCFRGEKDIEALNRAGIL